MLLTQITDQLSIWYDWRKNYKRLIPQFIEEAKNKPDWKDWDEELFYEYFERLKDQCVSSMGQGYFTKEEQKRIKYNWLKIAPLLKEIAENQDTPRFDLYESVEKAILKVLDTNKLAAIHRLIAGLQPSLLTTMVTQKYLHELYHRLRDQGIEIPHYDYSNWYQGSYQTLMYFKRMHPHLSPFELVTYPWQTLEYLEDNELNLSPMEKNIVEIADLLLYKKQIILQGPPGTGKTRLAKQIAEYLTGNNANQEQNLELTDQQIIDGLKQVSTVSTIAQEIPYQVTKVDSAARAVFLQKRTGSIDSSSFELIKQHYQDQSWNGQISDNNSRRASTIAKFLFDKLGKPKAATSGQCKIIQFHPSYTYEDFVRGIVAEPSVDAKGIVYEAKDKLIAAFAKEALDNFRAATNPAQRSKERWLDDTLVEFLEDLSEQIAEGPQAVKLTSKAYVTRITENSVRYNGEGWGIDGGVPISDLTKMYLADVQSRKEVKALESLSKTAKHLSTYWFKLLQLFREFIKAHQLQPSADTAAEPLRQYVLIIDEINRANLSSVLGELIYALEYRGEVVESMYAVKDSEQLVLPQNLLIIGTMNTADRSVGHIDYAIRRRFAFVDILPAVLTDLDFETDLFKKVSELFVVDLDPDQPSEYLSSEFRPKDVWIGHSYFIKNADVDSSIRLKYEIIPILEEYIKDGVLKDTAKIKEKIKELESYLAE